ncbi:iron chaperone [Deinococcus oregonensis]|uniref:Iron chaperone n=1 Tax=Deinococcus oregonensis TaxID=1805970 RepID=A0ABV6AVA1_9DEIO
MTVQPPKRTAAPAKPKGKTDALSPGFTAEERAAMKERATELKGEARRTAKLDGERAVLAKIGEMEEADRTLAERLHRLITVSAPDLSPKLWYGMPAYARDGQIICFFQSAKKFKTRYATLGFNDGANLDEGSLWPTAFALMDLTADDEARIRALIQKAISQRPSSPPSSAED